MADVDIDDFFDDLEKRAGGKIEQMVSLALESKYIIGTTGPHSHGTYGPLSEKQANSILDAFIKKYPELNEYKNEDDVYRELEGYDNNHNYWEIEIVELKDPKELDTLL